MKHYWPKSEVNAARAEVKEPRVPLSDEDKWRRKEAIDRLERVFIHTSATLPLLTISVVCSAM